MIITVTLNPAIDKTAELAEFHHGGLNRLMNVIRDAGGKGINVSKTISALGGESIATGFIGGSAGDFIKNSLLEKGIKADFVSVKGETRINLKVVEGNGFVTELNEPGPDITKEEIEELKQKLIQYASPDTVYVFAGSIPKSVSTDAYREMIVSVKEKGAKVFLDADGQLFRDVIDTKPDIIKPNRVELEEYFHMNYRASEEELVAMGRKFLEKGAGFVAVSLGQMGALFITQSEVLRCPGLKVEAHSTVGAGDAMVAGLTYGIDLGLSLEECVKLAMATSAGAVTTIGTKAPERTLVDALQQQVEILPLS